MRDHVQLITYADRLAGDLRGLTALLTGPLDGVFDAVHVLPFFTPIDGADAGFDPVDHTEVDPRLGDWSDVEALGRVLPVMADLIVNHVSADSPAFRDVIARGASSPHAGMFLTLDAVFPGGAREADLLAIYRPRPGLPLTAVQHADRTRRLYWTTFTPQQIDLDVHHPGSVAYLDGILDRFAAHGIRMVRLDAVGYAVKTPGTSSFMTPETFDFIRYLTGRAHARGIEVLVEVHSYWRRQVEIATEVDWVYDFALPPLVLHALYAGDASALRHWCEVRPTNAVTVLDTHDGIGVIDVGPDTSTPGGGTVEHLGLLDGAAIDALVEGIHAASGDTSRLATGVAASNLDLYQVNCTFADACGDEAGHLLARALQVFLPGVPQIYYVGLLGGGNDVDLLERTGVGRDINRHRYTPDEVATALDRPFTQRLIALLRLRRTHPAFRGGWELLGAPDHQLAMRWTAGDDVAELRVDLRDRSLCLRVTDSGHQQEVTDPLDLAHLG
ncbi:sucrose phosphorylase [Nitriliruptor alkaliphilus]|uniref:sucrose phosphorylase n=1 Tax=Nitriliruptor alkaliphilus TaxID=427918 RepID=UPI000696FD67|nr:sucrose phosphorylase [Nitriliruptor alkaliphilus]